MEEYSKRQVGAAYTFWILINVHDEKTLMIIKIIRI